MTREEAIAIIERLEHTEAKWPGTEDTLEALDMAIDVLRPVSRGQVEKVWRGEWKNFKPLIECQICGEIYNRYGENEGKPFDFCPACGAPMTDEAVEIMMERMEALYEE